MSTNPETQISHLLRAIQHPVRVKLLFAIGEGEACVCHLETILDLRQAYISQHLMALRKANILKTRRERQYIFYRLTDSQILDTFRRVSALAGVTEGELETLLSTDPLPQCCCPDCVSKISASVITEAEISS